MTDSDIEDRHVFGIIRKLVTGIAATDSDILETCPLRDVHNALTVGWLLILVWLWQCVLFSMVGHMMLARGGEWRVDVILGSVLIATVVLLVDSYVIVRSSWHLQGLSELKRAGLEIPNPWGARLKNGLFICVRLLISVALAMLTALFLSILLFEKDITANLEQHFQKMNAPLLSRITSQFDDGITKLKVEHEDIRRRLGTMADEEKQLRAAVIDPAGDHSEIKAAYERVNTLMEAKQEAQKELTAAEKHAADELGGARLPGTSGVAGYGPLRRAADEKVASARRKLATAVKDVEAAEDQLKALREGLKDETGTKRQSAEAKLNEIALQRNDQEHRLGGVEVELRKRELDRDRAVRSTFESDPAYRGKEDGFLARLEGLERISGQFHVWLVVVIMHTALFGIELAAVLAKIATFIPSSYTTILAYYDLTSAYQWVLRLQEEFERMQRKRPDDPAPAAAASPAPHDPPPSPEPALTAADVIPEEAKDIGEALRSVFGQGPTDINAQDEEPPAKGTTQKKRRGRPKGKSWRPLLKRNASQPADGDISAP